MPLTRPIPEEAMAVVEILRRDVKRPVLPMLIEGRLLRWPNKHAGRRWTCPMGMHPEATASMPGDETGFPLCSGVAVVSFAEWFDEQTDAQATTDAVWGEDDAET